MVNDLNNSIKTTLYTLKEVAAHLNVTPNFVKSRIVAGELSAIDLGSKRHEYRISEEALAAYLDSKKVTVASVETVKRCNVAKVPTIRDYFKVA